MPSSVTSFLPGGKTGQIIEEEQSFAILKLPFGILILSRLLSNRRLRKKIFDPPPLFCLSDSEGKTPSRKEILGCSPQQTNSNYGGWEDIKRGPV